MSEESSKRFDNMAFVVISFFLLLFIYAVAIGLVLNSYGQYYEAPTINEVMVLGLAVLVGFVILYVILIASYEAISRP